MRALFVAAALLAWGCEPVQPTPSQSGPVAGTTGPSLSGGATPPPTSTPPSSQPSAAPLPDLPVVLDPGTVPAALKEQYIVLGPVVGMLGSDVSHRLPEGERALGFGGGLIATVPENPETHELRWGGETVHVTIRDLGDLSEQGGFDTSVYITESVVIDSTLFWIGLTFEPGSRGEEAPIDAGIWSFDLPALAGDPVNLREGGNLADDFGDFASRGLLRAVDGETALTTVVQGEQRLATEVFAFETREPRLIETERNEVALAIAGSRALLVVPHEYAISTQTLRVVGYPELNELANGEPIDVEVAGNSVVYGEQDVFVLIGSDGTQQIVAFRLEDGAPRSIAVFDPGAGESFDLDSYLSSETVLALTPAGGPEMDDQGRLLTPVSLFDTTEGTLSRDVFTLTVLL